MIRLRLSLLISSLVFSLFFINQVNADKSTDCYSEMVKHIMVASMFTNGTVDFNDKNIKSYITDYCSFLRIQTNNFTQSFNGTEFNKEPPKSLEFLR